MTINQRKVKILYAQYASNKELIHRITKIEAIKTLALYRSLHQKH
jgi:hypothetical protein